MRERSRQALSAGNGFNSVTGSSVRRSLLTRCFSGEPEGRFQRSGHTATSQQAAQRNGGLGTIQLRQPAVRECGQNFRMNVTLATDGRCVAQSLRDGGNGLNQLSLDLPLVADRPFTQRLQGFDRGKPGAEVLGGEGAATRLAQVLIDVG